MTVKLKEAIDSLEIREDSNNENPNIPENPNDSQKPEGGDNNLPQTGLNTIPFSIIAFISLILGFILISRKKRIR